MPLFSRRDFLAAAVAGRLTGPEWIRYSDPATELQVTRLTDPAFASGMTAPHLHQFTRHSESLLYWSERTGSRQAFLLDLKTGDSRQLTEADALDSSSLSFSPDERSFLSFDGPVLNEAPLTTTTPREIYRIPEGKARTGTSVGSDSSVFFAVGRELMRVSRQVSRKLTEADENIETVMARPRRAQVLYRAGGELWLVNSDGSGKRRLKVEAGKTGEAFWTPSGRTLIYLHFPESPKELTTLREFAPEEGTDRLLAKTSQFISAMPNADGSVFAGASASRAAAYVFILLRAARREMALCEHHASDPRMVRPVFTPDSQKILFGSDRHGKPAIYEFRLEKFVEKTNSDLPEPGRGR